ILNAPDNDRCVDAAGCDPCRQSGTSSTARRVIMTVGKRAFCLCVGASLTGCATSRPISVRELADPRIQILKQSDALAAARGQLVLGNVGLALESFRKAQLAQPDNVDVLVGIADCYSAMGRFDVAQSNYETALALSPRDPK